METFERSSIAVYRWLDERLGLGPILRVTALHYVPRSVNWWYVFGSAVLTAFMFQIVTGIFLIFSYVPTPQSAYSSLNQISSHQYAGNILRGLHYWGASAMVMLIFIHMTAHFLTGSYKYPRELHWLTGTVLLILTIVMAFTGQLLRWNQDAYWAILVGAQQAARTPFIGQWVGQLIMGGPEINGTTLAHIYAVHVWLVPGGILTFIGIHLYLVIYKGISEWPVPGQPVDPATYWEHYQEILHTDGEPFFPRAVFKDALMATLLIVVVGILAVTVGAQHLGPPANPTTPAEPKPDWYLIWYFGVLALIGITSGGAAVTPFVIILFPLIAFGILFLIPLANKGERHPSRRPWSIAIVVIAALSTLILTYLGYAEPWRPVLIGGTTPPSLPHQIYANLPPSAQAGAKLMHSEACLSCHMVQGIGAGGKAGATVPATGGARGPDLTYVGDRLTYGEFIWRIAHGGGGMPSYGNILTPKQLNELVLFLESRKHQTPAIQSASGSP